MHPLSRQFAEYCESHFNLEHHVNRNYQSLPICIIDCVYSLRAKYEAITLPIVQRYADAFMAGDKYAAGDTTSALVERIEQCGGASFLCRKSYKESSEIGAFSGA